MSRSIVGMSKAAVQLAIKADLLVVECVGAEGYITSIKARWGFAAGRTLSDCITAVVEAFDDVEVIDSGTVTGSTVMSPHYHFFVKFAFSGEGHYEIGN